MSLLVRIIMSNGSEMQTWNDNKTNRMSVCTHSVQYSTPFFKGICFSLLRIFFQWLQPAWDNLLVIPV